MTNNLISRWMGLHHRESRYVDLLVADTFREMDSYPETLRQSLLPSDKLIVIDEIQKLQSMLDEV